MGRNMLVDGEWRVDVEPSTDEDGAFDRVETTFRDRVRDEPDGRFRPELGRYHLYVARNCPWAHGAALTRRLVGLTGVVTMDVVDPVREDEGWVFTPGKDGCTPDTVNGADHLREVYLAADSDYTGRVTVPVLWDREEATIVNNESVEVMRQFASAFADLGDDGLDLYPEGRREQIDRIVDELYEPINNGVYRAGFAESQAAYDDAVTDVFEALSELDAHLTDQRFLAGESLTLADIRLFPTLVRFDEVYHTHFRCNRRRVVDYPNLWGYTREVYQLPGVAGTVDMGHIKEHYYTTHERLNPKGIVPVGPDPAFDASHDRDRLPGGPPAGLLG